MDEEREDSAEDREVWMEEEACNTCLRLRRKLVMNRMAASSEVGVLGRQGSDGGRPLLLDLSFSAAAWTVWERERWGGVEGGEARLEWKVVVRRCA